jgi:glutamine synthetase
MYCIRADYVWTDVNGTPRDKTKIIKTNDKNINLECFPIWTFDGSSTGQAQTGNSDLLLKPVKYYTYNMCHYKLLSHYMVL